MLQIYAFRDRKSGVLSNHFITAEPFEKVKQNVSVSLLQLSVKDKTNPFVLFGNDYDLVFVSHVLDVLPEFSSNSEYVNCGELLFASRSAFEKTTRQTSPTEVDENSLE